MFGLGNNDNEERLWNLLVCKIYATDKEIENMAPFIAVALVIMLVMVVFFTVIDNKGSSAQKEQPVKERIVEKP